MLDIKGDKEFISNMVDLKMATVEINKRLTDQANRIQVLQLNKIKRGMENGEG